MIANAARFDDRALQEASRLAMRFEKEPHFTEQLRISATFAFKECLPALGIDRAKGCDE